MEEDAESFPNVNSQANILVLDTDSNPELVSGMIHSRGIARVNNHPLLERLLKTDDNLKHAGYTAHVLIQKQVEDYTCAVEDVIPLLKFGSESILENVEVWKGPQLEDGSLFGTPSSSDSSHSSSWTSLSSTPTATGSKQFQISQVGRKVLQISEAIKKIHQEDALAFWTSEEREAMLALFITVSKDLVKFRRKLSRIKDGLGDKVRNVRRAAIKCECEITGNIVPSQIYYQWVSEDAPIYQDNKYCSTSSSIDKISQSGPGRKRVIKMASTLMKTAKNLVACVYPDGGSSSVRESAVSTDSETDSIYDEMQSLRASPSLPVKVYQIKKEVEFIHREPSTPMLDEEESVCDKSLESFVASATCGPGRYAAEPSTKLAVIEEGSLEEDIGKSTRIAIELEEVWAAKPSPKYLDAIASNMAPPQKFATGEYVYDHAEAKIKEAFRQHEITTDNNPGAPSSSPPTKREVDRNLAQKPKGLLSENMIGHITGIREISKDAHKIITETMLAVREVERTWLNPPDNLSNSKLRLKMSTKPAKELYKLLDFIVETANLTENAAFATRIYPEDKDEIVSVLDPVLKELTNCYMAVYVFHNLVTVDAKYLKELVAGFPKGNLVVKDWVSDLSLDDELQDIEQIHTGNKMAGLDIDVDDLFA